MSLMDATPPPANEDEPQIPNLRVRRIPNLGHALTFIACWGVLFLLAQLSVAVAGIAPVKQVAGQITVQHPIVQILMLAATYAATMLLAAVYYPLVWHASFLDGVRWRWQTARVQALRLISLGLLLGTMMQIVSQFITPPQEMPVDQFFLTRSAAWLITFFGTLVAPAFEEIVFRGFLLPAFSIAYDWLCMERSDLARERWSQTATVTPLSLVFSAVLTSLLFALIHAQQVAHLWAALLALFTISLVLTWVRVKTESVAASTMVHAAYNGFIFVMAIVQTGGYRHLEKMR